LSAASNPDTKDLRAFIFLAGRVAESAAAPVGEDAAGTRQQINPQDCTGFGFAYKAHPPVHIRISAGGWCAADGRKDKQDVELFFAWSPMSTST
jgi:hypothetical protein